MFDYDEIIRLKKQHPAWRMLLLDNAPLIISFLYKVFIATNERVILFSELVTKLEDYIFVLRDIYGEDLYPKAAKEYINDWATADNSFLRVYYTNNSDEPEVDLTPATEKVFDWINSLAEKSFVGTESRLLYVFQLLRDMVSNTEQNMEMRLIELETQKKAIEDEISRVQNGIISRYDARQIKERFLQIEDTAQSLMGDFRQVEHNFRKLDREMRERIATSSKNKGSLLDDIFKEQDAIKDSDQGKSFRGFWEYLMSTQRQDELKEMLLKIFDLPEVKSFEEKSILKNIDINLLGVGEKVYRSYNLIADQLRRYLDNYSHLENRRITEIIKSIEKITIENKDIIASSKLLMEINDINVSIQTLMSRPLFTPAKTPVITENVIESGIATANIDILYQQYGIDETLLYTKIRKLLQTNTQISLTEVIDAFPLEHGLAEIITYLHIATKNVIRALIEEQNSTDISWDIGDNNRKLIKIPQIVFFR